MRTKTQILDLIKKYYNLKNDAALAAFLEIATTTLSSWKSRNSIDYDLIFAKCAEIDINWLIHGTTSDVTPKRHPKTSPQSPENVTPIVTPNEKNTFNPSDSKFTANFSADDDGNGCPLCVEKERLISALNEIIKSKEAIIRTKDDVIRCQNEYIDKLSEKRESAIPASAS